MVISTMFSNHTQAKLIAMRYKFKFAQVCYTNSNEKQRERAYYIESTNRIHRENTVIQHSHRFIAYRYRDLHGAPRHNVAALDLNGSCHFSLTVNFLGNQHLHSYRLSTRAHKRSYCTQTHRMR